LPSTWQLPPTGVLLWLLLFGVSVLVLLTNQPLGQPKPDLEARFRWLDVEERLRQRAASPRRSPLFRSSLAEGLLRPLLDDAGQALHQFLAPLGFAGDGELDRQLALARPELDVRDWFGEKVWTGIVIAALALVVGWQERQAVGPLPVWLWLLGFGAGYVLPDLRLRLALPARRTAAMVELSSVLDVLALSVSAGLGLEQALQEAIKDRHGTVGRELRRVEEEIRLNQRSLGQALEDLARRAPLPELATLASHLQAASLQGLAIADTLVAQAEAVREQKRLTILEAGGKATVTMLLPVALFILPVLFVLVLVPAGVELLHLAD
jgi:tight adherence protein C